MIKRHPILRTPSGSENLLVPDGDCVGIDRRMTPHRAAALLAAGFTLTCRDVIAISGETLETARALTEGRASSFDRELAETAIPSGKKVDVFSAQVSLVPPFGQPLTSWYSALALSTRFRRRAMRFPGLTWPVRDTAWDAVVGVLAAENHDSLYSTARLVQDTLGEL